MPELVPAVVDYIRKDPDIPVMYKRSLSRVVLFNYDSQDRRELQWVFGVRRPTVGFDTRSNIGVVVFNNIESGVDIYCVSVVETSEITVTLSPYEKMRN